jgi:uncharacterized protein
LKDEARRRACRGTKAAVAAAVIALVFTACGNSASSGGNGTGLGARQSGGGQPSDSPPSGGGATSGAYVPPSTAANSINDVINNSGHANSQLPSSDSLEAFMTAIINDVAADWNTRFQEAGDTYTYPSYAWVEGNHIDQAGGQCGTVGDPDLYPNSANPPSPAFACPSDSAVYLSVQWVNDKLWQPHLDSQTGQVDPGGTMAVGVTIAHEMTHITQFELGINPPPDATDVSSTELQADCGAGIWANDKYYSGQLQSGDIQVAEETLSGLGDYEFGNQQHHGTPNQRREAFDLGYNIGRMSNCTLDLPQTLPM